MARKRKCYPNSNFVWSMRIDNLDPYKQVICPQCGITFNKGGGIGPGKIYCSRKCFTRHRKENKKW